MKSKIIGLIFVSLLFGCADRNDLSEYVVYEVDSCEYIAYMNHFSHKGNCKFCAQRNKLNCKLNH